MFPQAIYWLRALFLIAKGKVQVLVIVRKAFSVIMLALLLTSTLTLAFNVQPVKSDYVWTETIYIRADGSIDPPTAPIQRDGDTYTLTGNITSDADGIVIERDNMTLDGSGCTLDCPSIHPLGIGLSGRKNVTIKNMEMRGFGYSIWLYQSSNIVITSNSITECYYVCIRLEESSNNSVCWNNITNNHPCMSEAIYLGSYSSNNSIVGNNMINQSLGIELYAYSNNNNISCNNIENSGRWGIISQICSGTSIVENNITANGWDGICLSDSSNNSVLNNNITNNGNGVYLTVCSNNLLYGNNITDSGGGMSLNFSPNNTLRDNKLFNNTWSLDVDGYDLSHFINDIDTSNTVNGKPIYYWINKTDMTVPNDFGYVALVNCTRMTIQNLLLSKNSQGILLAYTTNSTITKCNITANSGIDLCGSSSNTISENNITSSAIRLQFDCSNNSIVGNNVEARVGGVGIFLGDSSCNNSIHGNNITNSDFGIWLLEYWDPPNHDYSNYNIISGNKIANNSVGVRLDLSSNNSIVGNDITENYYGIYLAGSSNNSISGNNVTANTGIGIYLSGSTEPPPERSSSNYNGISGNNITNNERGIVLSYFSNYNSISGNNITANMACGIMIEFSSNNSISGNNITNNGWGVTSRYSSDNRIFHNNFISNFEQADSAGSIDVWDDGYPSGGNYWSDYEERYPDAGEIDDSGIWDKPYVIDENNTDRYPLMKPYVALLGDLDWDRDVDEDDLWYFCGAFIDYYKIHVYDPLCDLNRDLKIDEDDLWKMCEGFIDYWKAH